MDAIKVGFFKNFILFIGGSFSDSSFSDEDIYEEYSHQDNLSDIHGFKNYIVCIKVMYRYLQLFNIVHIIHICIPLELFNIIILGAHILRFYDIQIYCNIS